MVRTSKTKICIDCNGEFRTSDESVRCKGCRKTCACGAKVRSRFKSCGMCRKKVTVKAKARRIVVDEVKPFFRTVVDILSSKYPGDGDVSALSDQLKRWS